MTKVQSHVMLILHNVRMVPPNVRKNKGTTKCDKRINTYDIGTTHCEDVTIKCEEKNKGTTKYDKRTNTCDVGTAQCGDEIVKCEKKVREPPNVRK